MKDNYGKICTAPAGGITTASTNKTKRDVGIILRESTRIGSSGSGKGGGGSSDNVRVRDLKQEIREMLEELKFELDGQKIAKILNRRLMELELGKF